MANENKALIVRTVERKPARKDQMPGIKKTCFVVGNAKVAMIASAGSSDIGPFLRDSLSPGTNTLTDGWSGYFSPGQNLKHEPTAQGNPTNAKRILPLVHLQFSNLKSWLNGTSHGGRPKHLPAYLQEWNYRFNRRSIITDLLQHVIKSAVHSVAVT